MASTVNDSDANEESYAEESEEENLRSSRLLVTNEGFLDPSLLIRTKGYMHKKGGAVNARGGFRNWKKRWFVLEPVEFLGTKGYELQYYDGPNGKLKGKVGLSEVELFCENRSDHKKVKYEFQVVLQNGGMLQLSCDNPTEREEWIETLNMVIAYLRKVLTATSMTLDGYDPLLDDDEANYKIGEQISQNCQAFGPGLFGAEVGQAVQFVVQIRDLMGQQMTKGGMPVSATICNSESLYYVRVLDNQDGTYFAQYVLGRHGKYQLSIKINDEHDIFGSPFDIEILPSRTLAKFCVCEGPALQEMTVNSTHTFRVLAMDGYGNFKTRGGDPFEVAVIGPARLMELQDNSDGTYDVSIETMSPGVQLSPSPLHSGHLTHSSTSLSLAIMVTLHGKPIQGSPFKPRLVENPFDTSLKRPELSPRFIPDPPGREQELSSPHQDMRSPSKSPGGAPTSGRKQSKSRRTFSPPKPVEEGSESLSRLERTRQRALQAKQGTVDPRNYSTPANPRAPVESNNSGYSQQESVQPSARTEPSSRSGKGYSPAPASIGSKGTNKSNGSRLEQLAARGAGNLAALRREREIQATLSVEKPPSPTSKQTPVPKPVDRAISQAVMTGLKQGLGSSSGGSKYSGHLGPPPNATSNELKIWESTHQAFSHSEVLQMITENLDVLQQLFDSFCDRVEGVNVLKLTTSYRGGAYRMLELYDIIPTNVSRLETKALFSLITHAQKNLRSSASIAGGGVGLDFVNFLKFLVMLACHALSKTTKFSTAYQTIEAKVEVMLFSWGFADGLKLQWIRNNALNLTEL